MTTPAPDDEPVLAVTKISAGFLVPPALLAELDLDGFDVTGLLGRALNGEQVFSPPPPPPWHRCLACWLVSRLPGHDRCNHGRLNCDDCNDHYSDY